MTERTLRGRRLVWATVVVALLIAVSLVTVTITGPRVSVKWRRDIGPAARLALEARHDLRNGRQDDPREPLVWRYELGDWSQDAVASLNGIVHHEAQLVQQIRDTPDNLLRHCASLGDLRLLSTAHKELR